MYIKFFKILLCLIVASTLTACGGNNKIINTKKMPGNKVEKMLNDNNKSMKKSKNGVYVIKDNTTYNNTGKEFKVRPDVNVGPDNVRFDSEHFKTKY